MEDTPQAIATVSLHLPIRIQVPDDHAFAVHLPDGQCELRFTEKPAPERADGMRAEGFDDGKGTYVRSTATVEFQMDIGEELPLSQDASGRLQETMRLKAWDYLAAFLRPYSHIAHHLESRVITKPEGYALRLVDPSSGETVAGFPQVTGHVFPGPLAIKATLTNGSVAQLSALLRPGSGIQLPDEILLQAETEASLLDDVDHAVLDVAAALEVFLDQLMEREIHFADAKLVRRLRRKGVYTGYDRLFRVLGRPSLKDEHPRNPPDDRPLAFELLEFIFVVRNNIIHRGVNQFTLNSLKPPGYVSPYLDRHEKQDGLIVTSKVALGLIAGARQIIDWVRTDGAPRR